MAPVEPSRAIAPEIISIHDPDKAARERLNRMKIKKAATKEAFAARKQVDPTKPLNVKKLSKTDYHDMLRFGISELKGEEKSQARMRLAIELGAKRPKKGMGNYKMFLQNQNNDKEERKKQAEERQILATAVKKANPQSRKNGKFKRKKRLGKNEVRGGGLDGQIGKYKHGIQFISKKDF